MTPIVTRIIILFLVFLQSIAPLVHAHSGYTTQLTGIHIPGLEFISAPNDAPILSSITCPAQNEGTIIYINSGVHIKQPYLHDKTDHAWTLIANADPDINFNLSVSSFLPTLFFLPYKQSSQPASPRAPPV